MNSKIKLFLLFSALFILNAFTALSMKSPFMGPNEACTAKTAMYLAKNLDWETCSNILSMPLENVQPLYSILISSVYVFTSGTTAYHIVLIFNAFLVSTLVFPLWAVFKRFLASNARIFFYIILVLLIPQIVLYGKTLTSETLFLFFGVWSLKFYVDSFFKNKDSQNSKLIAFALSIPAAFTLAAGFILPLSMVLNEIAISGGRNKKAISLFYLPSILILCLVLFFTDPDLPEKIRMFLAILSHPDIVSIILKSLSSQFGNLVLTTMFAPLVLFIVGLTKKNRELPKGINVIRWFLLIFVFLNFLFGVSQIIEYHVFNISPGFFTRYLNLSSVYIVIFGLIFLDLIKNPHKDKKIFFPALLLLFFFFSGSGLVKPSLDMDIIYVFNLGALNGVNPAQIKELIFYLIFSLFILFFTLLMLNKKKILISAFSLYIVISFVFMNLKVMDYSSLFLETINYFPKNNARIVFLEDSSQPIISMAFWKLTALSDNKVDYLVVDAQNPDVLSGTTLNNDIAETFRNSYDFVVSGLNLDFPLVKTISSKNAGRYGNEYVYKID